MIDLIEDSSLAISQLWKHGYSDRTQRKNRSLFGKISRNEVEQYFSINDVSETTFTQTVAKL
jgi:hypothetical protein